jgi:hypothetical protein
MNNMVKANPELSKDVLKAREDRKKKREEFRAGMDENLSPEEREKMLEMFDQQMNNIEKLLKKEREDNENSIAAKLAARNRKLKRAAERANDAVA